MADRPEIEEAANDLLDVIEDAYMTQAQRKKARRALADLLGKQSEREKWSVYIHPDGEYLSLNDGGNDTLLKMPEGWRDRETVERFVAALAPLPEQSEHARFVCSACGSRSNKQRSTMDVPLPEQSEEAEDEPTKLDQIRHLVEHEYRLKHHDAAFIVNTIGQVLDAD